ncbi:hypothetical protein L6452_41287 [Arctium lappa]|uniref:Uncharacterized protein n=1 Tax=Arctium lappa TaxID=4217 RepID=A0ACB8XN57_ARCLA|nr:hypothetical protein L6452_41287 [Arctium lappa]
MHATTVALQEENEAKLTVIESQNARIADLEKDESSSLFVCTASPGVRLGSVEPPAFSDRWWHRIWDTMRVQDPITGDGGRVRQDDAERATMHATIGALQEENEAKQTVIEAHNARIVDLESKISDTVAISTSDRWNRSL